MLQWDKMGDTHIEAEQIGNGITIVTINRPDKRNALNLAMWQSLGYLFDAIAADPDCRAVILKGGGEHFSAGADISEFGQVRDTAKQGLEYDRLNDIATLSIRNCPYPVIAAISGFAVGGGLSLALACDFRVAGPTVRMGIPAGRLGLVYSILDCRLLTERIGTTAAKELLLTGTIFDQFDATRLGLIDVATDGNALDAAVEFARRISVNAPLSLIGNKTILNSIADGSVADRSVELEGLIARAFDSEDYAEGQRAFAEKRSPQFRNR